MTKNPEVRPGDAVGLLIVVAVVIGGLFFTVKGCNSKACDTCPPSPTVSTQ